VHALRLREPVHLDTRRPVSGQYEEGRPRSRRPLRTRWQPIRRHGNAVAGDGLREEQEGGCSCSASSLSPRSAERRPGLRAARIRRGEPSRPRLVRVHRPRPV